MKFIKKNFLQILIMILIITNIILGYFLYKFKNQKENLEEKKDYLQIQLTKLNKNDTIKKYIISKNLSKEKYWSDILNQLFNIYTKITKLEKQDINIENMRINEKEIKMTLITSKWKYIYEKGNFIYKLSNLKFIKNIQIPLYQQKNYDIIKINLTAKLNIDE